MKIPSLRALALTLIALGMVNVPSSANDDKSFDEVQIQKMFDKLRLAVIGTTDAQKYTWMSLTTLGIPIREGFSETNPGDLELLEQQFDFIPRRSPLYTRSTLKFSDVYGHILNDRSLVVKSLLTDEQKAGKSKTELAALEKQVRAERKKKIDSLTADLDPDGDPYKLYVSRLQDQNTADNALRVAKNTVDMANASLAVTSAMLPTDSKSIKAMKIEDYVALTTLKKSQTDDVNTANTALASAKLAKKLADTAFLQAKGPETDAKIGTLYTLQNYNGEAWWKKLRETFDAAKIGASGDSYDIKFFPAPSEWNPVGSNKEYGDPWPDESKAYAGLPGPIDSTGNEVLPGAASPATPVAPPADTPDPSNPPADAGTDSTEATTPAAADADASTPEATPTPAPAPKPASTTTTANKPPVDVGWVTFTFKHEDVTNATSSSAEANSFSASCSALFYSASAGGSDHTAIQTASTTDKSFKMTVQLKLVSVFRPWMDLTVFKNNSWVIGRKIWSVDGKISYGFIPTPAGQVEPLMPMYLDTLILAKNLTMEGTDLSLQANAIQTAKEAHASASYGCFNVSGAHSDAKKDTGSHKLVNATKIVAPGVQIIGVLSSVLDECPSSKPPADITKKKAKV